MKHSSTVAPQPYAMKFTWAGLILIPLLIAISWGAHFTQELYSLLQVARSFAGASVPIQTAIDMLSSSYLAAYLFAMVVSIPARFGIDPSLSALILSAIGWSAAAFIILALGTRINRPYGAMIAALLLSFNPGIINLLGSPVSWILALFWMIILLFFKRRIVAAIIMVLLLAAILLRWPAGINLVQAQNFGQVAAWSIILFIAGVGAEWLPDLLSKHDLVRLTHSQTKKWLLISVFVGIGLLQVFILWQLYQARPAALWQLQEEVAEWLSVSTPTSSSLLADEKIGYLAGRPTAEMPDLRHPSAAAIIQESLRENTVDYLLTTNDLPFQQLSESSWLRLTYEPVQQFNAASLISAPYTIWSYRQPLSELGERHVIDARVPDRLSILGYQIGAEMVQPGESVQVALYLQAPENAKGPASPFDAIIRLVSPIDGSTVSEWLVRLPQSITPDLWKEYDVLTEQFPLAMPNDLPAGAYRLNLSLIGSESAEMWPFSLDKDINRLDRIPIGGIVVPWTGSLNNTQKLDANFADMIELTNFSISEAKSGEMLEVALFWEAQMPIDGDFVVFVHVLNNSGELLASHDSRPENGRFPTLSWPQGIVIPDIHRILLPDTLPAGEYQIKAGLYELETGERVAVTSYDGNSPADKAVALTKISIP